MTESTGAEILPDMREVRERRQRLKRRKRVLSWSVAAGIVSFLLVLLLFSPIGPWGHLLFSSGLRKAGNCGKNTEEVGEGGPSEAPGGEARKPDGPPRKNSVTDPPCVAIVVDDVGNGDAHLQEWMSIEAPLTFSVLPFYELGPMEAEQLYQAGFQVMLHVPTVNAKPNSYSGKGQLELGMDRSTVFSVLDADLAQVPHAEGVNNHQGGAGCDDYALMRFMCEWASERGLYVVDSNSSARSQVTAAMESLGMRRRRNQVFIDHDNDPEYIRGAMRKLAELARRNGTAIGICHWQRPNTARIVSEMVRTLRAEGINFAFVRDVSN